MNEKVKKIIKVIFVLAVFIASLVLTIVGHRNEGPQGLSMMLTGLAGLILLLWMYNRQYK